MQLRRLWNGAYSRTFQGHDIKFQELSRTCTDFHNFPGHWDGGGRFQNFQELSRRHENREIMKTQNWRNFQVDLQVHTKLTEVDFCPQWQAAQSEYTSQQTAHGSSNYQTDSRHTSHQRQISTGTTGGSECRLVSAVDHSDRTSAVEHTPIMSIHTHVQRFPVNQSINHDF